MHSFGFDGLIGPLCGLRQFAQFLRYQALEDGDEAAGSDRQGNEQGELYLCWTSINAGSNLIYSNLCDRPRIMRHTDTLLIPTARPDLVMALSFPLNNTNHSPLDTAGAFTKADMLAGVKLCGTAKNETCN
jgi:hypothetical protein